MTTIQVSYERFALFRGYLGNCMIITYDTDYWLIILAGPGFFVKKLMTSFGVVEGCKIC